MAYTGRKIALLKNTVSTRLTRQNEGFVKKIRFHYAEKLLSPAGISKKYQ